MDSRYSDIFLQAVGVAPPTEQQRHPKQQRVDLRIPTNAPSVFDILSGRGQGVQRHPGNVKYRRLVSLHKGLYARCPSGDKAEVSKGIVAAVREFGGRFLELDERTGSYRDIGDKKAWDKTSQALREGQKMMREKPHSNMASDDFDMLAGAVQAKGYFGYSFQVLESLWKLHEAVPPQTPPSRGLKNPSPVRAPRAAPRLDAPIGDGVETVEGTGVDRSAIRRDVGGRCAAKAPPSHFPSAPPSYAKGRRAKEIVKSDEDIHRAIAEAMQLYAAAPAVGVEEIAKSDEGIHRAVAEIMQLYAAAPAVAASAAGRQSEEENKTENEMFDESPVEGAATHCFDPPEEPSAEAGEDKKIGGKLQKL